jgi:hypothetical protein
MPIFDFSTDGSGVTSVTDRRQLGALAIGAGATAEGGRTATGVGRGATASASKSTALGHVSEASASKSTALGHVSEASAESATTVGHVSEASGVRSTSVGAGAFATLDDSAAFGTNATAAATHEGVLGVPVGDSGPYDWRVPGTFTVETEFTVPVVSSDPSGASDGDIWYNSAADEYRGVEDGTTVRFDTTSV